MTRVQRRACVCDVGIYICVNEGSRYVLYKITLAYFMHYGRPRNSAFSLSFDSSFDLCLRSTISHLCKLVSGARGGVRHFIVHINDNERKCIPHAVTTHDAVPQRSGAQPHPALSVVLVACAPTSHLDPTVRSHPAHCTPLDQLIARGSKTGVPMATGASG